MSKIKKRILIIITSAILAVFITLLFIGNYLVNFAIVRTEEYVDVAPASIVAEDQAAIIRENKAAMNARSGLWHEAAFTEKVSITSHDGLKLAANLYITDPDSHKWLIGIHGYKSNKESFFDIGYQYAQQGYNILLPDMRSHGESEGTYIGMGWLEKEDALQWLDYVIAKDPDAKIIVQGTSMGGATVMMLSGEELPENVKGIIEDCGYTSVREIFEDELDYLFGLPPFPVLDAAEIVADLRAGYNFREASSLKQLKKSTVPMLFIHGSADNFVKSDMVYEVYEACPTAKDLLIIEGAGHAESQYLEPELYYNTIFDFIQENCIPETD